MVCILWWDQEHDADRYYYQCNFFESAHAPSIIESNHVLSYYGRKTRERMEDLDFSFAMLYLDEQGSAWRPWWNFMNTKTGSGTISVMVKDKTAFTSQIAKNKVTDEEIIAKITNMLQ